MEMQSSSSHSQISAYERKARYIASVLLSIGRPTLPSELAEKFTFLHWSPEFVQFLCCIPNSPLVLTHNGLITLSHVALVSLGWIVASSMLRVEIGGRTVPKSLGENTFRTYYRKRKRLDKVAVPSMKKTRSDLSLLGEGKVEDTVPDFDWMTKRNFQEYADLCTSKKSIVNVPTMSIKDKEDKIEQNAPSVDHIRLQETEDEYLDDIMHRIRRAVQFKIHPFLVQPPSPSPRADSFLLDGICTKDFMSNMDNYALPCVRIDEACHLDISESPSAIKAVEDYGGVGDDVPERTIEDPGSSSDILEKVASFKNDPHKESMNDSKNKVVAAAAVRKTNCTLSAYEPSISEDQQMKSPFKAIQKQQYVLAERPEGLSKVIEQIDVVGENLKGPNASPIKNKIKHAPKLFIQNLQKKSPCKAIKYQQDFLALKLEKPSNEQADDVLLKGKCLTGANASPVKNKIRQTPTSNISIQEKNGSFCSSSSKDHLDSKVMPKFDLYIVEDEEGSGGYGTVYRARRKSDGMKFAIKYPHANANKYHIVNERKMLERFGGKDFVIKYEGSCKSENSDCFVLKHVEHDRPDVLKKDINISELQWYGYCMFTALRSLHKQGVVHRDVKPGNFLFSRKNCLGYIIDFNLAKDLHLKQPNTGNYPSPHLKTVSPSKRRKILDTKASELAPGGLKRGFKPQELKMLRNKVLDASHRNSIVSQGADGSGLTSAKDLTSTKTPSAERLREPLPCQGRKELINLAQEAIQISEQEVTGVPSYKRKRIAAPSAAMGRKPIYCTPMHIHSSGIAVPGSGFLKEGGKKQKEGSCSGTKGFRAPEVLLRSMHQGPKVDVWSAGATLLYLMTGRMAFTGEPEQNMRDIVKLRGSEQLWEIAKLHNREATFPKDLYDVHYFQSMELRSWCKGNTKRPEFLKTIPSSLFDLVDRCLTVNPRSRISAEEALRHEFFAPCVDAMRKKRLLKQHVS